MSFKTLKYFDLQEDAQHNNFIFDASFKVFLKE